MRTRRSAVLPALVALTALGAASRVATATELTPPPPAPDALVPLGVVRTAPGEGAAGARGLRPFLRGGAGTGLLFLDVPSRHARELPPRTLRIVRSVARTGAFDVTLDSYARDGDDDAGGVAAPTGATHFEVADVRANAIGGDEDVVDDLVAAAVRTPEPGALALFAAGAAALLAVAARRRRVAR